MLEHGLWIRHQLKTLVQLWRRWQVHRPATCLGIVGWMVTDCHGSWVTLGHIDRHGRPKSSLCAVR